MSHTRRRTFAVLVTGAATALAVLAPVGASHAAPSSALDDQPRTVTWTGEASSGTGAALAAGSCDVNADGYDDVVAGAWFWDKAPTNNVGGAYVLLGSPEPAGGDLSDPTAAGAVRIDGPSTANALTGFSVGCLGDVNNDGFDDIALSYYTQQKVVVVLGADDFGPVSLDNLGARGFTVTSTPGGNFGYAVAGIGDVNDDGFDDYAVAAIADDTRGRTNNGRVWLLAGRAGVDDLTVADPQSAGVLGVIDGAGDEDRIGSIAAAGDVNGDGIDDLVAGSYVAKPHGADIAAAGAAYIVLGRTGAIDVDAGALTDQEFAVVGPTRQRDRLGISVAPAGDLNDDGLDDLLIGADGVSNATTGPRTGGAAVVFGSAETDLVRTDPAAGTTVYACDGWEDCDEADRTRRGLWLTGATDGDSAGYAVAATPSGDLVIGAYGADPVVDGAPLANAGIAYVLPVDPAADLVELSQTETLGGRVLIGDRAGDRLGRAVATGGDMDGNKTPDLVASGDSAIGSDQAGIVKVELGADPVVEPEPEPVDATVKVKLNKVKAKRNKPVNATVRVSPTDATEGAKVQLRRGPKIVGSGTVRGGKVVVKFRTKKAGTYQVWAVLPATDEVNRSVSAKVRLRIVK